MERFLREIYTRIYKIMGIQTASRSVGGVVLERPVSPVSSRDALLIAHLDPDAYLKSRASGFISEQIALERLRSRSDASTTMSARSSIEVSPVRQVPVEKCQTIHLNIHAPAVCTWREAYVVLPGSAA